MHRFECEHGVQFIDLHEIAAIQTTDKSAIAADERCRCYLRGNSYAIAVPVSAEELHALVKAAKEPNSVPYTPRVPIDYFTGLPAQ